MGFTGTHMLHTFDVLFSHCISYFMDVLYWNTRVNPYFWRKKERKKITIFQYRRYLILRIWYLILFDTVKRFKISTFDRYSIRYSQGWQRQIQWHWEWLTFWGVWKYGWLAGCPKETKKLTRSAGGVLEGEKWYQNKSIMSIRVFQMWHFVKKKIAMPVQFPPGNI